MPDLSPVTPLNLGQPAQLSKSLVKSSIVLQPTFVNTTPRVEVIASQTPAQDPTQPWKDLPYESQTPLSNSRPAVYHSAAPAFGFTSKFTVADLNRTASPKSKVIDNADDDTTSTTVDIGTNRQDVSFAISSPTATFDLNIYEVDPINGNVLMKSWVGVHRFCTGFFIGGQDGIVLSGAKLVYEVKNITDGATVSLFVEGL